MAGTWHEKKQIISRLMNVLISPFENEQKVMCSCRQWSDFVMGKVIWFLLPQLLESAIYSLIDCQSQQEGKKRQLWSGIQILSKCHIFSLHKLSVLSWTQRLGSCNNNMRDLLFSLKYDLKLRELSSRAWIQALASSMNSYFSAPECHDGSVLCGENHRSSFLFVFTVMP